MLSAPLLDLADMTFRSLAAHPVLLALTMMVATFFLEDVATVAAGLLVSQMVVAPLPALLAVLIGTILGDLALHLMGRFLAQTSWGLSLRSRPQVAAAESWLSARSGIALGVARFVPGLRLPVYAASGFIRTPFLRVAGIVVAVSLIWTPTVFWLSAKAGAAGSQLPPGLAVLVALLALALITLAPRLTHRVAAA
mgnify:CR=1 FL=1